MTSESETAAAEDRSSPPPPPGPAPSRRVLAERKLRRKTLSWVLRARTLDRRERRDPDFIVVGAQKAGSTSLYAYLAAHPDVEEPLVKEINYFDLSANRGQDWYRRHFPLQRPTSKITGEASPMYMVHPLALDRIARDLPEVKVVAVLREPVDRLMSHYRHSVRLGHEDLPLDEALAAEPQRIAADLDALRRDPFHRAESFRKFTYLRRSLYSDQVAKIQQLFPYRSLFLRLEDLSDGERLQPLCEFLGIRHEPETPFEAHNVNTAVPRPTTELIGAETLQQIDDDARRTCELLGWAPWGSPAGAPPR